MEGRQQHPRHRDDGGDCAGGSGMMRTGNNKTTPPIAKNDGEDDDDDGKGSGRHRREKIPQAWLNNYDKLSSFRREYGHCNVTRSAKGNREHFMLAKWALRQRNNADNLSREKRKLLDGIGFDWTSRASKLDGAWEDKFRKLELYRRQHGGSCDVPVVYDEDQEFATWVSNQKKMYSLGKLRKDRKDKLDGIQFYLSVKKRGEHPAARSSSDVAVTTARAAVDADDGAATEAVRVAAAAAAADDKNNKRGRNNNRGDNKRDFEWEKMYRRLVKYKEKYGNCSVPYLYEEDPSLAMWVSTQRRNYNQKTWYGADAVIKRHRFDKLTELGFSWDRSVATRTVTTNAAKALTSLRNGNNNNNKTNQPNADSKKNGRKTEPNERKKKKKRKERDDEGEEEERRRRKKTKNGRQRDGDGVGKCGSAVGQTRRRKKSDDSSGTKEGSETIISGASSAGAAAAAAAASVSYGDQSGNHDDDDVYAYNNIAYSLSSDDEVEPTAIAIV